MSFGDLPAQDQSDSTSAGFCRIDWTIEQTLAGAIHERSASRTSA